MINKISEKVFFDAANESHMDLYKEFLIHSKWKEVCPFKLEYPWQCIPDMLKDKAVRYFLGIEEIEYCD